MKKKEHKTGDIIILSKKKFGQINMKRSGLMVMTEFLAVLYGQTTEEIWTLIREEYPEVSKKYQLSYTDCKLKIGREKDNDY